MASIYKHTYISILLNVHMLVASASLVLVPEHKFYGIQFLISHYSTMKIRIVQVRGRRSNVPSRSENCVM